MRVKRKKPKIGIGRFIIKIMIFICFVSLVTSLCFILYKHKNLKFFTLKHIVFVGNKHLTDNELMQMANIRSNSSIISVSNEGICKRLMGSAWIKGVSVRKELPDRLTILIKEAEPFALLDMKGKFFIVDEDGRLLEEIHGNSVSFLPVINGDPFRNREAFKEGLQLIKAIKEEGLMTNRESILVLAERLNELSLVIDGMNVKIGAYDYQEKLQHFAQLEDFLKSKQMDVEYIDLRFKKKAYVKPVNSEALIEE